MAKKYQCNPKIKKFNQSIINSPAKPAKRAVSYHNKGRIQGIVSKINK